jgi:hypothetical protein
MGRELKSNLVPAMQKDVGMMVGGLGCLGDAVDEDDRLGEVLELPLARDRLALPAPLAGGKPRAYVLVGEKRHTGQDTPVYRQLRLGAGRAAAQAIPLAEEPATAIEPATAAAESATQAAKPTQER